MWKKILETKPPFDKQIMLYWLDGKGGKKEQDRYELGYLTEIRTLSTYEMCMFSFGESYDNSQPTHWAELTPPH